MKNLPNPFCQTAYFPVCFEHLVPRGAANQEPTIRVIQETYYRNNLPNTNFLPFCAKSSIFMLSPCFCVTKQKKKHLICASFLESLCITGAKNVTKLFNFHLCVHVLSIWKPVGVHGFRPFHHSVGTSHVYNWRLIYKALCVSGKTGKVFF